MSPIDLNIEIDLIRHDFLKGFIFSNFYCAKYDEHVECTGCLTCKNTLNLILFCVSEKMEVMKLRDISNLIVQFIVALTFMNMMIAVICQVTSVVEEVEQEKTTLTFV